jgi:LmbE family N-acetylglucosaminyl deacetylase
MSIVRGPWLPGTLAAVLFFGGSSDLRAAAPDHVTPGTVAVSAQTRAVVIAPHPDDAALGAGGLVQRILSLGGSVEVVEMTSGDAFSRGIAAVRPSTRPTSETYRWYGSLREREDLEALRLLGIGRSRIRLLGFPDDGLCELTRDGIRDAVFESPYTGRDSPPLPEQVLPGAKYRAADLRLELENVLLAFRPTLLVVPDPRDDHPDHCATHLFVHDALELAVVAGLRRPDVLHFLIHASGWPDETGPQAGGDAAAWQVLHLTAEERDTKNRAIEAYHSQVSVMATFLHAFEKGDEWFGGAERDATAPPCWCRGANIVPRVPRAQRGQ